MMIAHSVYFSLNDNSSAAIQAMVQDCHKYLSALPGIVFYSAGTCSDVARPVSDRDYDVALVVVFQDRPALDAYSSAPKHVEFIGKHERNWKTVRVFDACVSQS